MSLSFATSQLLSRIWDDQGVVRTILDFLGWPAAVAVLVAVLGIVYAILRRQRRIVIGPVALSRDSIQEATVLTGRTFQDLEGYWLQEAPTAKKPLSICQLRWNGLAGSYSFDGTNYNADGTASCTWTSLLVHAVPAESYLLYVFSATVPESVAMLHGFGLVRFQTDADGRRFLTSGHFRDMHEDSKANKFSIIRVGDVAVRLGLAQPGDNTRDYHAELIRIYSRQRQ